MARTSRSQSLPKKPAANDNRDLQTHSAPAAARQSSGYTLISATEFPRLPQCLTVAEAAERLKHCAKWVRQQLRLLQIPVLQVGAKILIPEAHLALFFSPAAGPSRAGVPNKGR
jgi:hypothetical protein